MPTTPLANQADADYGPNLLDTLHAWAQQQAQQRAYVYLADGENISAEITYAALWERVTTLSQQLLQQVSPGERAVLCLESEAEFLIALLACFRARIIAVPSLTPSSERTIKRIEAHLSDSGAAVVLFDGQAASQLRMRQYQGALADARCLNIETLPIADASVYVDPKPLAPNELAYLQYTSGSTTEPRGAMITHGNLMAQLQIFKSIIGQSPQSVSVNWMPLYHDFGLVMGLQSVYTGGVGVLLPPSRVVQQPIRWLRAIDRFRATLSAGATFMFELCARKIRPEDCLNLDLSHWQQALVGAEPIHAAVLNAFTAAFADYGFRPTVFWPGYGMAEATLIISLHSSRNRPVIVGFDAAALQKSQVLPNPDGQQLVGSGLPCFGYSLHIINPDTLQPCQAHEIGELWVHNPSVGSGYWQQASATQHTFNAYFGDPAQGPFLRTGDLGFIYEGEVFIIGRLKDTLVINGENRYPQDIEWTVNHCHPALESGAGVAVGIDVDGIERLAICYEIKRSARNHLDVNAVVSAIRAAVVKQHELDVHKIVLLQTASLPKTSSGKVQRQACKNRLLGNDLATLAVWQAPPPAPLAALSDTTHPLLTLCQTILNDTGIGLDDDLFAHGADSLKSMELFTEIEKRWQCRIDMMRFNQQPTVNGLQALIDEAVTLGHPETLDTETANVTPGFFGRHFNAGQLHKLLGYTSAWQAEWVSPKRLIFGLNTQGSKPPLFWCCQGYPEFAQLARYLGADQPVYGMRSGHLIVDYKDSAAITGLASRYLEEILSNVPQDTYLIGGNCQAGVVATRLALMLAGLGERIQHLFVLENIVPRVNTCPLPFRIAIFYGQHNRKGINPYLHYPVPDSAWKKLYPLGYTIDFVKGSHGQFFKEPNIQDFANKLALRLQESLSPYAGLALPEAAFAAQITAQPVSEWRLGASLLVTVQVTNTSPVVWPSLGQSGLIIANHWLDTNGQPHQWLDGYAPITQSVLPGQTLTLTLPVVVPSTVGAYVLEIDLAEQGIAWFIDKTNPAYQLHVDVIG